MKVDINSNIFELDKLLKAHHYKSIRLQDGDLIAITNRIEGFAKDKIKEYSEYWTNKLDKDFPPSHDKIEKLNHWKEKILAAKNNQSAFNGEPSSLWSAVQYGGYSLISIIIKIKDNVPISNQLKFHDLSAVIGANTLLAVERHMLVLESPNKRTIRTFKWKGNCTLEVAYGIINNNVFSTDMETFKLLFTNKPINQIKKKVIRKKTIGYLGFFFKTLMNEKLIEDCSYQAILKATFDNINTISKETGKIVNNTNHKHYQPIVDLVESLK